MARSKPSRQEAGVPTTTVQQVLDDARTTDFTKEDSWRVFQEKHSERLRKAENRTKKPGYGPNQNEVLHELAENKKKLRENLPFAQWAIEHHDTLLECEGERRLPPLHLAIERQNHEFVKLVLKHARNMKTILQLIAHGKTCLHLAICCESPLTKEIIKAATVHSVSGDSPNESKTANVKQPKGTQGKSGMDARDIFRSWSTDETTKWMTPLHIAATLPERQDAPSEKERKDRYDQEDRIYGYDNGPELVAREDNDGFLQVDTNKEDRCAGLRRSSTFKNLESTAQRCKTNVHQAEMLGSHSSSEHVAEDMDLCTRDKSSGFDEYQSSETRFDLTEIVRMLVEARPNVLMDCGPDGNSIDTPFQLRLAEAQSSFVDQRADENSEYHELEEDDQQAKQNDSIEIPEFERNRIIESDPILSFMRSYIINNFDRREATKALYRIGEDGLSVRITERALQFDLNGSFPSIDRDFLHSLEKVLRFEGVLKYVALPLLKVEDSKGLSAGANNASSTEERDEKSRPHDGKGKGLEYMCDVFEWLKSRGVKSVVKVTVMDNGEKAHSDEAILSCLKGLDVRIWQWYKIDLCSDVIFDSARKVIDVTLYSSGNNSVLMGWSSPAGLAQLQELERVHVYYQEGLEKPKTLERYLENFKKQLMNSRRQIESLEREKQPKDYCAMKKKADIDVTWSPYNYDSTYDAVFTQRDAEKPAETRWMKTMRDFGRFLRQASRVERSVERVKIAIIDDGINTKDDIFTDCIQAGESFQPFGESSGRWGAFYIPSGEHGTLMARLICETCLVVKLYIAQLEVFDSGGGRRSINADSAAEAVTWATEQGVDIISMSWSVKESLATTGLSNALGLAQEKKIIMFCSSIDEGATTTDATYPGANQRCITIGACTDTGARLSWVSSKSQFLLPGDALQGTRQVKMGNSARRTTHSQMGLFGSSVSTALAAGLAGDLLYCDRLLQSQGTRRESLEGDELKEDDKMSRAFNALSVKSQDSLFLQVWDHIPQGNLYWNRGDEDQEHIHTKSRIQELMRLVKTGK